MTPRPDGWLRRERKANPLAAALVLLSVCVLMVVAGVILAYAWHFRGGLSDRQEVWAFFGDYFGGVLSVVLSFFSLVIALYVLLKTNQDKRFERIYHFMDEFRSDRMSSHLKLLWDFYDYDDFTKRRKPLAESEKKRKLIERYRIQHNEMTDVYLARRSVSYFYLYLSIFLQKNRLDENSILSLWPVSGLSTLETIIMPCEQAIAAEGTIPDKFIHFDYLIRRWRIFNEEMQARHKALASSSTRR